MKIASFNINGIKARLAALTDWLVDRRGATDPTVAAPILPVAGVDPVPEAPT